MPRTILFTTVLGGRWALSVILGWGLAAAARAEELQLDVSSPDGRPLPCRVHLRDAAGQPVFAEGRPRWKDHFVCDGRVPLQLPAGSYHYEIERGPEHQRLSGELTLRPGRDHTLAVQVDRVAHLAARGWYGGDLHVHRPLEDAELLLRAEDLHVAQFISWWNQKNLWSDRPLPAQALKRLDGDRYYDVLAGEDERGGGALLFFHLPAPWPISGAKREAPSSAHFAAEIRGRSPRVWIDAEKPFWWDFPLWLGLGLVDSVGVANNHMCRSEMYANEAWGKARDAGRLPDPLGNGYWTQEIYYHALNCGFRLPPSAGSASGVLPNPVGYNRVYVQAGEKWDYAAWWAGLKAGRCFVTNGPLLLVRANGEPPGTVFQAADGKAADIELEIELTSLDRVPQLEIVQNGEIVQTIAVDADVTQTWRGRVRCRESGWFLVRAVADHPRTFRFASTAPFYVEVGDEPRRISRQSVQFFADWLHERVARVTRALDGDAAQEEVLRDFESAEAFWAERLKQANAE